MKVQVLFEKGSAKFIGHPKEDGKASFQSDAAVARHFDLSATVEEMVAAAGVEWLHRLDVLVAKFVDVQTISTSTGATVNREIYTRFVQNLSLVSEAGIFEVVSRPGQGAIYTIHEIAKEFGYNFIDIRCIMLNRNDFLNVPMVDDAGRIGLGENLSIKKFFRQEGKTLIVLDEFSKMPGEQRDWLNLIIEEEMKLRPDLLIFKVN